MPRKKKYIEEEVIEKAMHLFWKHGYENTSMQMLEKEMGINKFSIYSSFGNKQGVFTESIKMYNAKTSSMFEKFIQANNGIEDIKTFFYDSIEVSEQDGNQNGCLVTNTYNEFAESDNKDITDQMNSFMGNLKNVFIEKLSMDSTKDKSTILKQANFLLLAKHGLAAASRVNSKEEIKDYIEMTFKNL